MTMVRDCRLNGTFSRKMMEHCGRLWIVIGLFCCCGAQVQPPSERRIHFLKIYSDQLDPVQLVIELNQISLISALFHTTSPVFRVGNLRNGPVPPFPVPAQGKMKVNFISRKFNSILVDFRRSE